ncbi:351_t:CDS:1 [Ambispora gerdemannii]|uniref:351_t:CDS:1 n=1 Tax=Ambispora gerdemannii TaxID=144530 RepID=A0A9N9AML5_9GLOM|nr:351_t:CDS:1 [Ambispora gerdemannii]
MLFKNLLPILATFLAAPYLVNAFPNGAGTCDADPAAISKGHGASLQPNSGGPNGFTISTAMNGATYDITLNGPKSIKGLLVYVVNAKGDRIGDFTVPTGLQAKACGGTGTNTLTQKDATLKKLPMKLSYNAGAAKTGQWKVMSLVVQDKLNWNKLDDTTFDLATGKVVTNGTSTSPNPPTTSSPTTSKNDTNTPATTNPDGTNTTDSTAPTTTTSPTSGDTASASGASYQADISSFVSTYSAIIALVCLFQTMNRF